MDPRIRSTVLAEKRGLLRWMASTLRGYRDQALSPVDLGFARLGNYFPAGVLERVAVVIVPGAPPLPPLLATFANAVGFAPDSICAITYRNTYFVQERYAGDESLHFHEIVHTVQWERLGAGRFVLAYAQELLAKGYTDNFFERQAFVHERRFAGGGEAYDAEAAVLRELEEFLQGGVTPGRT